MYSIIDIESNGDGFREEKIIDIAIFQFDGHRITDQFISLVNPEAGITHFVQKLTKITPKMVKTAPKFHEIAKRVIEITAGTTLVGHNIEFDYRMLRQSFHNLGYSFTINTIDTIPLAQKLIPEAESYSLGKLVQSLGIPLVDRHRAGGDARATLELFKLLLSKDTANEIIQKQRQAEKGSSYINKINDLTRKLPSKKGIIYFQKSSGEILFSDFTDNISKFANKLFNSKSVKHKVVQELCEQVNYELAESAIIAKLLMKGKGIRKRENLPYGLFRRNREWTVEKNAINNKTSPFLKFKSYTQAIKALNFINQNKDFADGNFLKNHLRIESQTAIWTLKNEKNLGKKPFLILENARITAFGFYDFHTQIQNVDNVNGLKINVKTEKKDFENDLKLALLQSEVEIYPFPSDK